MSDVGKPVDVGPTMIEGVNELVGDDPAHVGLVSDIILAQNDLGDRKTGKVLARWLRTPARSAGQTFPLPGHLPEASTPASPSQALKCTSGD